MSKAKIVTRTKRLTEEQYAEMRTRFQMGDSIREIAREFNYDSGNLTRRFKKDGVIQGELQHLINKKVLAAAEDLKTITADIQQITSPLQHPIIQNRLNERAAKWLGIVEDNTNIAFRINQKILQQIDEMSEPDYPDGYKPHQSAMVMRTLGVSHDKLLEQTGISAESLMNPDKGNGAGKAVVINFNPVKKLNE